MPWLLILTAKDGSKRLRVEVERRAETSLQLRHFISADLPSVELIDAAGNLFTHVNMSAAGIDWATYRIGGLFAPIALAFDVISLTAMVRIRIERADPPTLLSLSEIKEEVSQAILGNQRAYTWAPAAEIVRRVRAARDAAALIRSIAKD
jgi:hypothetical protein